MKVSKTLPQPFGGHESQKETESQLQTNHKEQVKTLEMYWYSRAKGNKTKKFTTHLVFFPLSLVIIKINKKLFSMLVHVVIKPTAESGTTETLYKNEIFPGRK